MSASHYDGTKPFRLSPKEARAAWIAELRSGNYLQGKGKLRRGDHYCCLGVACELYLKEEGNLSIQVDPNDGTYYYDRRNSSLPPKVQNWLGMKTDVGDYRPFVCCLAEQNDEGTSFADIADLIEIKTTELFVTKE